MKKNIKIVFSLILTLLILFFSLNCSAYKRLKEKNYKEVNISNGSVSIYCNKFGLTTISQNNKSTMCDNNISITGTTNEYNVNVLVESTKRKKINIRLDNLNINLPSISQKSAIKIRNQAKNTVIIRIKKNNYLVGGKNHAGIYINNQENSNVVFTSFDGPRSTDGKLYSFGGKCGAGIGGGYHQDARNIRFTGATIISTGGENAAGIGGGRYGDCENIEVRGGDIFAYCGERNSERKCLGAGIGGGYFGNCKNISISGGSVVAVSSIYAAGIGGGYLGSADNISVTGGNIIASGKGDVSTSVGCGLGSIDVSNIDLDYSCFSVSKDSAEIVICYTICSLAGIAIILKLIIQFIFSTKTRTQRRKKAESSDE